MMAKGKARTKLLDHSAGLVEGSSGGSSWGFLYETATVKHPDYNVGDRVVLPDGRAFRYAKAGNIISSTNFGLKFWNQIDDGVTYVVPDQGQAVGDVSIHITAAGITLDELRGGYVTVHTHAASNDQFRGILGNTATDADGDITIYLDAPLTIVVTVAMGVEVHQNPYSDVRVRQAAHGGGGDRYSSVAGMANSETAVANQYLWLQTWGPCWVNPQTYAAGTDRRAMWFDYEGSIVETNANVVTKSLQYAGFIIDRCDAGGTGQPLLMLQINP
jgi:hypothetical protein